MKEYSVHGLEGTVLNYQFFTGWTIGLTQTQANAPSDIWDMDKLITIQKENNIEQWY